MVSFRYSYSLKGAKLPTDTNLPVLDSRAKHGLAGEVVRLLHGYNEGDEATLLVEYLTLFGAFLGLKPHFFIGRTPHYARLYVAVVGQSASSRKGTTFNLVRAVFEGIDPAFLRFNIRKNVGSDQGIISAALESIDFAQRTGVDDGRLLVVENEFVTLLRGGTLQRTSPMIRDAWDVSVLQSTVKRARVADPVHLSIIGMITLDELRSLLPNQRVQAQISNGLFNRFLTVLAQPSKHLRLDQMEVPDNDMERLAQETERAIQYGRRQKVVRLDSAVVDAQFAWRQEMVTRREREYRKAKVASRMFDLLNRGETYLLRLALIYAMLDQSPTIGLEHYTAAEGVWDYVEGSVRYIFEMPEFTPNAQKLLEALRVAGPAGLSARRVDDLFNGHRSGLEAVRELLDSGLAIRRDVPTGGRPTKLMVLSAFDQENLSLEDVEDKEGEVSVEEMGPA